MTASALRPALILVMFAAARLCFAQPRAELDQIEEQIGAARFDEADAALESALASGKLDRASLSRAHLLAGVIASARRDENAARASFRRALTLNPDAILPQSAGPHVAEAFEQARSELGEIGSGLGVVASSAQPRPGTPARIDVRVVGDAERIARRLRIVAAGWREERPVPPLAHELELPSPSQGCVDVSAELLDAHDNRLWKAPSVGRVCAAATATEPASPSSAREERPIGIPVWIGVALTGAGVVTTSVLGVIALDRRSEYDDANQDPSQSAARRRDLHDNAQAAERRATIAAIATAVVAAGTVTLYVLRPTRSGPVVGLRMAPGALGATLGARF